MPTTFAELGVPDTLVAVLDRQRIRIPRGAGGDDPRPAGRARRGGPGPHRVRQDPGLRHPGDRRGGEGRADPSAALVLAPTRELAEQMRRT
ncbi:MAG: hypothetical protein R2695_00885 [Acidimicrobiales bacterium]